MATLIDLSHTIHDGMVTHPGLLPHRGRPFRFSASPADVRGLETYPVHAAVQP